MANKCWKKVEHEPDYIIFESKRGHKIYKGQPAHMAIVERHPLDKKKWTMNYGQALINYHEFDTKEEAMREAEDFMDRFCSRESRRK